MTRGGTSSSIDISDIDIGSKKWGFQRHIISNPLNPRYYYDPAAALLRGRGINVALRSLIHWTA
jgi:hypothetical protein